MGDVHMSPLRQTVLAAVVIAAGGVSFSALAASAAELPKATQAILKALKLDPSILSGLDQELAVPQEWIDGAKKEGAIRIGATWDPPQYRKMTAAFVERYPFIEHEYSRGSRQDRTLKPLLALETSGRVTTDLIGSIGATYAKFKAIDALVDMRDLPGWKNVPDGMKDPEGLWVGQRLRYWCMSYNTDKVKKEDLPKTWDDLLTNPIWRNGALALSNRPNLWFANVWALDGYGEAWGKPYLEKLFGEVKPQLRKEGNNALLGLLIAGEFKAVVPGADYRTKQYFLKKAPIAWHCPEPVPLAISELSIVKGNPHPYASKLWVNWFLSKEGQIAQYYANHAPPVHKDLQTPDFLSFADEIVGKKVAFRDPVQLEEDLPKIFAVWNPLWDPSGHSKGKSGSSKDKSAGKEDDD
jgi:iron(III) transport system substrate-binding protein